MSAATSYPGPMTGDGVGVAHDAHPDLAAGLSVTIRPSTRKVR
jgi:hypothetical protein